MATKKVNEQMIKQSYDLARAGFNDKQIYETIGISRALYYRSVDIIDTIKEARRELKQEVSKSLLANAVDMNNHTVQIFLAKKLRLFDDTFNSITLKKSDDVLKATSNLFKAVADGSISEDKANQLKSILDSFTKAYELNELEQRLTALEEMNQ
jgi:uncharacterized protein YbjQ (UPF0145 family)